MTITTPFQTLLAVQMTCEDCVKEVSGSLSKLAGIVKVEASVEDQLVSIEGTAAPSTIVEAIKETGRDAILRGSGNSNSAAVCIFETHSTAIKDRVRGLARMVQVSPSLTLIDLAIRGLPQGKYWATVRETGDISQGAISTGGLWKDDKEGQLHPKGILGLVVVGKNGVGQVFIETPFQIWELIGRAMVLSMQDGDSKLENSDDTLVGVIARSAGVWDNDKTVCSCSGKTLWEERNDEVMNGMI